MGNKYHETFVEKNMAWIIHISALNKCYESRTVKLRITFDVSYPITKDTPPLQTLFGVFEGGGVS